MIAQTIQIATTIPIINMLVNPKEPTAPNALEVCEAETVGVEAVGEVVLGEGAD